MYDISLKKYFLIMRLDQNHRLLYNFLRESSEKTLRKSKRMRQESNPYKRMSLSTKNFKTLDWVVGFFLYVVQFFLFLTKSALKS